MKKRNKVLSILLAGTLVLGTAACGSDKAPADNTQTESEATGTTDEAPAEENGGGC